MRYFACTKDDVLQEVEWLRSENPPKEIKHGEVAYHFGCFCYRDGEKVGLYTLYSRDPIAICQARGFSVQKAG